MLNVLIKLYFTIKLKQNKKGGARRGYAKVKKLHGCKVAQKNGAIYQPNFATPLSWIPPFLHPSCITSYLLC